MENEVRFCLAGEFRDYIIKDDASVLKPLTAIRDLPRGTKFVLVGEGWDLRAEVI